MIIGMIKQLLVNKKMKFSCRKIGGFSVVILFAFIILSLSGLNSCSNSSATKMDPSFSALMKKTSREVNYFDTSNINRMAVDFVIRGSNLQQEGRHAEAILEFQDVIKNYPGKEKVPAAMLKQAMAFKELGDAKSAKYLYKKLIELFPASEEAKSAKDLLKGLK